MTTYNVGDTATITSPTFVVGSTPTNPVTLTLVVTDPLGVSTAYAIGTLSHPSTGRYTKTVTVTSAGEWSYLFTATSVDNPLAGGTFNATTSIYCTVADVKAWMGVTDTNLDTIIDTVRGAASRWIDARCHRPSGFGITAATARYFDVANNGLIYTDDIADAASVAIATDTAFNGTYSTTWNASDYQLLPLNAPAGWPEARPYWQISSTGISSLVFPRPANSPSMRSGLIRVTAKWGWPEVPAAIRLATIMQTARLTQRRTSPQGVAGFNDFGVVRVSVTDRDIDELLQDFMLMSFA